MDERYVQWMQQQVAALDEEESKFRDTLTAMGKRRRELLSQMRYYETFLQETAGREASTVIQELKSAITHLDAKNTEYRNSYFSWLTRGFGPESAAESDAAPSVNQPDAIDEQVGQRGADSVAVARDTDTVLRPQAGSKTRRRSAGSSVIADASFDIIRRVGGMAKGRFLLRRLQDDQLVGSSDGNYGSIHRALMKDPRFHYQKSGREAIWSLTEIKQGGSQAA